MGAAELTSHRIKSVWRDHQPSTRAGSTGYKKRGAIGAATPDRGERPGGFSRQGTQCCFIQVERRPMIPVSRHPPAGREYLSILRQTFEDSFSAVSIPILQVNILLKALNVLNATQYTLLHSSVNTEITQYTITQYTIKQYTLLHRSQIS